MRKVWAGLNLGRNTVSSFKRNVGEVKTNISSYLTNSLRTSNAVAEGSQDIAKLVGWLPYKVRLQPASVGYNTVLSKRGDALYISEHVLQSPAFQEQIQSAMSEQGLSIDAKKLTITMDYFGRLQFLYPGQFNNQPVFLDQFGKGTPSHTALTNALTWLIVHENKKICAQIALWHILKDTITKNNRYIKGSNDGKSESFWLQEAASLILSGWSDWRMTVLENLLQEQGVSIWELKDILNEEWLSPKDIINRYPSGRKVMDHSYYNRQNQYFSFEAKQQPSEQGNTPTPTSQTPNTPNNQPNTQFNNTNTGNALWNNTQSTLDKLQPFISLDDIDSIGKAQRKIDFINRLTQSTNNLDVEVLAHLIDTTMKLEEKIQELTPHSSNPPTTSTSNP